MRNKLLIIPVALLTVFLLSGCDEDIQKQVSKKEDGATKQNLISCQNDSGEPTEYLIVDEGEEVPTNVGAKVEFVKIAGNDHCYSADQFQNVTQPDKCPETHYHGNKTATDGCVLVDDDFETCCGVALTKDVTFFVGYEFEGDSPSDTPPPSMYGEDIMGYCGPDVTLQLSEAAARLSARIGQLPEDEKGIIGGTKFLDKNGNNIDFKVSKQKNDKGEAVCPSETCMAADGQGTVIICGQCVMEHVANDIMFGMVGGMLGVPYTIQNMGANYAEWSSYGGMDPQQSKAAYVMGNDIVDKMGTTGSITVGDLCDTLNNSILTPDTGGTPGGNGFQIMGAEKDFLIDCAYPPDECKTNIIKDFSTADRWL